MTSIPTVMIVGRLLPTAAQEREIREMIRAVNAASTDLAAKLLTGELSTSRGVALPSAGEALSRSYGIRYGHFHAAMEKACDAHAFYRAAPPVFARDSAIPTTVKIASWLGPDTASICCLRGRLRIPAVVMHYQANSTNRRQRCGLLGFHDEQLLLMTAIKLTGPMPLAHGISLDLGLIEPQEGDLPPKPMSRTGRWPLRRLFPELRARDLTHREPGRIHEPTRIQERVYG